MPDVLALLETLGNWSLPRLWLPIALWTGVAGLVWLGLHTHRRVQPHVRYAVALALLLALPLSLIAGPVLNPLLSANPPPVVAAEPSGPALLMDVGVDEAIDTPAFAETPSGLAEPPPTEPALTLTWSHLMGVLVVLALFLALHGLLRLAWTAWSLHRFRQRLIPSPALQAVLDGHRRTWKVRRPVQAAVSSASTAPFTFGWLRPVIVMPDTLHGSALELAITHELVHLRRHDFAVRLVEAVLVAVFGWHPLVRVLSQRLGTDRERLCDTELLAQHPAQRRAYATLLLSLSSAPAPRLALSMTPPSSLLTERIEAMNTPPLSRARLARFRWTARLLGLTLFVIAASLVGLGTAAALPDDRPLVMPEAEPSISESSGVAPEIAPLVLEAPRSVADQDVRALPEAQVDVRRDTVYEVVEQMPVPIGGIAGIQNNLRFPELAQRAGIEGRAFVQFVVNEAGQVEDAQVVRGLGAGLDEEALRVVRQARFTPGRQGGEAVKVRMNLPITFHLPENNRSSDAHQATERQEALIREYVSAVAQTRAGETSPERVAALEAALQAEMGRSQDDEPTDEQLAELEAAIRAELTAAQTEADALMQETGSQPNPEQRAEMVRLRTRVSLLESRYQQIVEQQERRRLSQMEAEIMGRDD